MAATEAYNASVTARVEADGGETRDTTDAPIGGPGGVVTWPTRYGNPEMEIAPATPTVIGPDGLAVPVTSADQAEDILDSDDDE